MSYVVLEIGHMMQQLGVDATPQHVRQTKRRTAIMLKKKTEFPFKVQNYTE